MLVEHHIEDSVHYCDALVIHCIDFRFHANIRAFLRDELKLQSYDLLTVPGGAKYLTGAASAERRAALLDDIAISMRLHNPKQIILINHADCGGYGGIKACASVAAEMEVHTAALREASNLLSKINPKANVLLGYAAIDDGKIAIRLLR